MMASRPILLTVASAVTILSIGAGTYLASRSSRLEASRAAAAAPRVSAETVVPAPAPETGGRPAGVAPLPQPSNRGEREKRPAVSGPGSTGADVDRAPARTAPVEAPPVSPPSTAPPPLTDPVTPPPAATATAATPPALEAPASRYDEITIKEDSVIGIRLDQTISTATAKVEDRVTARVTRDVTVDGRTAIPAGTRIEGIVSLVEPPGRFKTPARIGVRFTTLILGGNLRVPIRTEAMYRNGQSPAGPASAKIGGGAVAGAIIGGVIGGRKGAIIGGSVGAAGGTGAVMASDRDHAIFESGSQLTVRLSGDIRVQIERDPYEPSGR
jgi:hypothetical protein